MARPLGIEPSSMILQTSAMTTSAKDAKITNGLTHEPKTYSGGRLRARVPNVVSARSKRFPSGARPRRVNLPISIECI